jgi:exodeoxyribonuclease VII large subunit
VSGSREEVRERIIQIQDDLYGDMQNRLRINQLLLKPFSREQMEQQFRSILQPRLIHFDDAKEQIITAVKERVSAVKHRLALAVMSLEAGSPAAVMERGFSIVMNKRTGNIVRSYTEVKAGDTLTIRPAEGIIHAVAEAAQAEETP